MKQLWRGLLNGVQSQQFRRGDQHSPSTKFPITVIDADSNLFRVGGNSSLAIRLRSVINETLGIFIPLPELFRLRTPSNIAERAETGAQVQISDPINDSPVITVTVPYRSACKRPSS
ncbi:hypothetical protein ANO14919_075420 [Xylariales sp. No.14919]|nr:hypothetical protein ANO14919_075420 [Xylariales sp. No.14919]